MDTSCIHFVSMYPFCIHAVSHESHGPRAYLMGFLWIQVVSMDTEVKWSQTHINQGIESGVQMDTWIQIGHQ